MHIDIVKPYLEQLAADHENDPLGFLWEFAPVHDWWHSQPRATRPIGFLTFHWIVIQNFGKTFSGGQIPVEPSPLFQFPGIFNNPGQFVNSLDLLEEYSNDLESWHNQVHQSVGGTFLDAAQNVYLSIFWQFHTFLNLRFVEALNQGLNMTFDQYLAAASEAQQRNI